MKSILLDVDECNIFFKVIGVDDMVYKTDINSFVKETGMTVSNIAFPIYGYYISLSDFSNKIVCGNVIENIFYDIKKEAKLDNTLLVFDFNGVDELSESFYKSYTKMLLETSNKVITINMNTALSNEFGNFIYNNIIEPEEEE